MAQFITTIYNDGVIFISIDDNEVGNIRKLCDEIFGEENFAATFVIKSNPRGSQSNAYSASVHEYALCYLKNFQQVDYLTISLSERMIEEYKSEDENGKYRLLGLRQRGGAWRRSERPLLFFPIFISEKDGSIALERTEVHQYKVLPIKPTTEEEGSWRWSRKKIVENISQVIGKIVQREGEETWDVFQKNYLLNSDGEQKGTKAKTLWDEKDFNYQNGTNEVKELFNGRNIFDFPKPTSLQKRMVELITATDSSSIVLDFFSGSCPTAHAVLDLNKEDNGNRKFIMIQLPEPCDEKSEAYKAGYKTIADIGKERIRRVIKKIKKEKEETLDFGESKQDLGFKVFKLDKSNFKIWDGNVEEKPIQEQLAFAIDHIDPNSKEDDILYEILIKSGFELTTPVETLSLEGKKVYSVAEGALLICLEMNLTTELIRAIAKMEPQRVVCLDSGFEGNDQLKTNAVQIMKSFDVESFRTV